jgi:hypothetical protein
MSSENRWQARADIQWGRLARYFFPQFAASCVRSGISVALTTASAPCRFGQKTSRGNYTSLIRSPRSATVRSASGNSSRFRSPPLRLLPHSFGVIAGTHDAAGAGLVLLSLLVAPVWHKARASHTEWPRSAEMAPGHSQQGALSQLEEALGFRADLLASGDRLWPHVRKGLDPTRGMVWPQPGVARSAMTPP